MGWTRFTEMKVPKRRNAYRDRLEKNRKTIFSSREERFDGSANLIRRLRTKATAADVTKIIRASLYPHFASGKGMSFEGFI